MHRVASMVVLEANTIWYSQAVDMGGGNYPELEIWAVSASGTSGFTTLLEVSNDLAQWTAVGTATSPITVVPSYQKYPTTPAAQYARYVRLKVASAETTVGKNWMFNASISVHELSS